MKVRHRSLLSDLLIFIFLFCLFIYPVQAAQAFQTIDLQFPADAQGGSVEILEWKPEENLSDLQDPKWIAEAQKEAVFVQKQSVQDARAVFSDLEPGIYLIRQPVACDGYRPIDPFLVDLRNGQSGTIDAEPKMARIRAPETDKPIASIQRAPQKNTSKTQTAVFSNPFLWMGLLLITGTLGILLFSQARNRKKN